MQVNTVYTVVWNEETYMIIIQEEREGVRFSKQEAVYLFFDLILF